MLLYYLFWMLILHFYIIFGTNLLTGGPAQIIVFLPISVFHKKGMSNGVQTEWNLQERDFWNKRDLEDLEWMSRNNRGVHEAGGAPPPSWAPYCSIDLLLPPIYLCTPKTSRSTMKPYFHRHNHMYPWDPILGPFPAPCQRGIQSRRASKSTLFPFWWSVSSLPQTYGSIASS